MEIKTMPAQTAETAHVGVWSSSLDPAVVPPPAISKLAQTKLRSSNSNADRSLQE